MMLKKKEKRIIRIKNSQLRKFRNAMRELLKAAQTFERRKLRNESNSVGISDFNLRIKEEDRIERQIEVLDRALRSAPIECRVCGRQDIDLVFNPMNRQWYCEGCYTFNQKYYKENPHPCEPNWKKLYP